MKNKILLATGLSVLLLSTYITQDKILNKISSNYKEDINSFKFFNIKEDKKDYVSLNIDKNKPIIIIYDKFKEENHGKKILNIINSNKKIANIFLFDINKKELYDKNLNLLRDNVNFYQFLYNISNNNQKNKIILNISGNIILNEKNYDKNKKFVYKYNLNFIDLIYKLNNVTLNKAFGNISGEHLKKSLIKVLNDFNDRNLLINNIDNNISYDKININKIKKHFHNEFKNFKNLNPEIYGKFMKEYLIYKKRIKYEAIDLYSILYALKSLNLKLNDKVFLIKGISINEFKSNYENLKNYKNFPEDLNDFYFNIKNIDKIDIENNLNLILKFNKLNLKYHLKYPTLYKTNYDFGLENHKSQNFITSFDKIYFKNQELIGTSYSTSLKTLTDLEIEENKKNLKKLNKLDSLKKNEIEF